MIHTPLPSIDVHRKLNGKRLLTLGIIAMLVLTSFAVVALMPARAHGPPDRAWWFVPGSWPFEAGSGSSRNMIVLIDPMDSSLPSPMTLDTTSHIKFDMVTGKPDANGVAKLTIPNGTIKIDPFYVRNTTWATTLYLWAEIIQADDGTGLLDTDGGNDLLVDVYTTVTGNGVGNYTLEVVRNNNVTGTPPPGSMITYLPLKLHIWSGKSKTNPTPKPPLDVTIPLPLNMTTGYSRTVMAGPAYPGGSVSISGQSMSAMGVPSDPYTAIFQGVATGGALDLFSNVSIPAPPKYMNLYSDFIFKEILVGTPNLPIPDEPIRSTQVKPLFDRAGGEPKVYKGDPINFSAVIYNGLESYSAYGNGTTYLISGSNSYAINKTSRVDFNHNQTRVIWFVWDGSTGPDVPYGNYTVRLEIVIHVVINGITYNTTDYYVNPTKLLITIPGDTNFDGDVCIDDFATFSGAYVSKTGQPAYKKIVDLNRDDSVDVDDFAIFSAKYKIW